MSGAKDTKDCKEDILIRLRRIEGQVKGISRMIEEEKSCTDVLTQIAAVKAAINKVGGIVLEKHSRTCLVNALEQGDSQKAIDDLLDNIQKFLKYVD